MRWLIFGSKPDRRLHGRLPVSLRANLYFGEGYCENSGYILNISERGFLFEMMAADCTTYPSVGSTVQCEFVDSYTLGGRFVNVLMQKYAVIRHVETVRGRVYIGCSLKSDSFRKYVLDKELIRQIEDMQIKIVEAGGAG